MTTTTDLKAAALAALARSEEIGEDDWYLASDFSVPDTDALFIATASPEAVYALIERLQVAEDAAKANQRPAEEPESYEFIIEQDGICVASASAESRAYALNEIMRYAEQYEQDGPITISEVFTERRFVAIAG